MIRPLIFLLSVIILIFTVTTLWLTQGNTENVNGETPAAGTAAIGGAFTLLDTSGQTFTDAQLRGKLALVFFGFTHCPDICPTTLNIFTETVNMLGDKASHVTPVFITVDPARDTPEHLKEYLKSFHPSIVGLTGTAEQVKAAQDVYKVYSARQGEGENYMMNHSGIIYLMGRDGSYITHFNQGDNAEKIAAAISAALEAP